MLVSLARLTLGNQKSAVGTMKTLSEMKATLVRVRTKDLGRRATVLLAPELTPEQRTSFLNYLDRAYTVYNQMRVANAWFLGPAGDLGKVYAVPADGSGAEHRHRRTHVEVDHARCRQRILPQPTNSVASLCFFSPRM